jgi:hypothetical protein
LNDEREKKTNLKFSFCAILCGVLPIPDIYVINKKKKQKARFFDIILLLLL